MKGGVEFVDSVEVSLRADRRIGSERAQVQVGQAVEFHQRGAMRGEACILSLRACLREMVSSSTTSRIQPRDTSGLRRKASCGHSRRRRPTGQIGWRVFCVTDPSCRCDTVLRTVLPLGLFPSNFQAPLPYAGLFLFERLGYRVPSSAPRGQRRSTGPRPRNECFAARSDRRLGPGPTGLYAAVSEIDLSLPTIRARPARGRVTWRFPPTGKVIVTFCGAGDLHKPSQRKAATVR